MNLLRGLCLFLLLTWGGKTYSGEKTASTPQETNNGKGVSLKDTNINYYCIKYKPPLRIKPYSNGKNCYETPLSIVFSQYTQMGKKDWENFITLWDDFYLPYTRAGVPPPAPEKFISAWNKVLKDTRSFLMYKVKFKGYHIFIIDYMDSNNNRKLRSISTVKKTAAGYRLTRDLSQESNPLEQVLDNPRFDPYSGNYLTADVGGHIIYNGELNGQVHIAVVREFSKENWDTPYKTTIDKPGTFLIPKVVMDYKYIVKAYLDADNNGKLNSGDPRGKMGPINIIKNMTEVEIKLQPPE